MRMPLVVLESIHECTKVFEGLINQRAHRGLIELFAFHGELIMIFSH
jgi:hypothetical protein